MLNWKFVVRNYAPLLVIHKLCLKKKTWQQRNGRKQLERSVKHLESFCVCGCVRVWIHTFTVHRELMRISSRLVKRSVPTLSLNGNLTNPLKQPAGHFVWSKITSSAEGHWASIPWARKPGGQLWSNNCLTIKALLRASSASICVGVCEYAIV